MKTIRTKLAKVQFAYFVQRDQHRIIAKDVTQSSILMRRFRCSCRRSVLSSLMTCLIHVWRRHQTRRIKVWALNTFDRVKSPNILCLTEASYFIWRNSLMNYYR